MSFAPQFSKMFNKLATIFQPRLHVVGLGRWGSTITKEKNNVSWFHDTCNYDNCYTSMFSIIRFKHVNPKKPPNPQCPAPESNIIKTNNTITVLPVHYALEMPPKIENM